MRTAKLEKAENRAGKAEKKETQVLNWCMEWMFLTGSVNYYEIGLKTKILTPLSSKLPPYLTIHQSKSNKSVDVYKREGENSDVCDQFHWQPNYSCRLQIVSLREVGQETPTITQWERESSQIVLVTCDESGQCASEQLREYFFLAIVLGELTLCHDQNTFVRGGMP